MRLSMNLGQELRQSLALSMRQSLESKLLQDMRITQTMRLELKQYLKREDQFKKLYRKALQDGRVFLYENHGLKFEFAAINRNELKSLPLLPEEAGSCGFAHALYDTWDEFFFGKKIALSRASWLLFVVYDFFGPKMPQHVIHYVACHEHGEETTLGQHHLATKLEFAISHREKQLSWYIKWLRDKYPTKFTDVFSHQTAIVLPDSDEFQKELELRNKSDYASSIRQMIEGFEWPLPALKTLSFYKDLSERTQSLFFGAFTDLGMFVERYSDDLAVPKAVEMMRVGMQKRLEKIGKDALRWVCLDNIHERGFREHIRSVLVEAFAKWVGNRRMYLESRHLEVQYLQEISCLGAGLFPEGGFFSTSPAEIIASVKK